MKLYTYILDTEGGSDWTDRQTVLAKNRKEADDFMLPLVKERFFDRYTVVLAVEETEFQKGPCLWSDPREPRY